MSIIVTGMKMPQNCLDYCPMFRHGTDNYTYCVIGKSKPSAIKRSDDCPLKSVDGLIEKITEYRNKINAGGDEFKVGQLWGIDEVTEIIKEYCEMEGAE